MNDPERTSIDEDADNEFPPLRRKVGPVVVAGIIVLVALDSGAHDLWPTLPLADAYEQNIALHIKS